MSFALKKGLKEILKKSPDDVVVVTALRTPIARFNGAYKDTNPEVLLAKILGATRERLEQKGMDVSKGDINDISTGNVLMELGGHKSGRTAALHAGSVFLYLYGTVLII